MYAARSDRVCISQAFMTKSILTPFASRHLLEIICHMTAGTIFSRLFPSRSPLFFVSFHYPRSLLPVSCFVKINTQLFFLYSAPCLVLDIFLFSLVFCSFPQRFANRFWYVAIMNGIYSLRKLSGVTWAVGVAFPLAHKMVFVIIS